MHLRKILCKQVYKPDKSVKTFFIRLNCIPADSSDNVKWQSDFHNKQKLYESHLPTTFFQKVLLSIGASLGALLDTRRGDLVAISGEAMGVCALESMYKKMQNDAEGQRILIDRPIIHSSTVNLEELNKLPENTLGKVYVEFLHRNKIGPDGRLPVQFVDDVDLAYVMRRYREIHDIIHAILFMDTNILGEVIVKWVEGIQTGLPMCLGGGLFGALRLRPKQRKKYVNIYLPWAIAVGYQAKFLMNVYFEERWHQNIKSIYSEFHIPNHPNFS